MSKTYIRPSAGRSSLRRRDVPTAMRVSRVCVCSEVSSERVLMLVTTSAGSRSYLEFHEYCLVEN